MRNILLTIAYDGTAYSGWQRQHDRPTLQGTLEDRIRIITGEQVSLHGAGRTDAGVHALAMTANFITRTSIPYTGFVKGLNSMLPADIRILAAEERAPGFHARKNAIGKEYQYFIRTGEICLPTERLYCHHISWTPKLELMRESLGLLKGKHDFTSFEASGSRDPSVVSGRGAVRTLTRVELLRPEKCADHFSMVIAGDGFLRHMVRNIVGTLLEVGRGSITPSGFAEILAARDRNEAGPTAPAQGLFLNRVDY
ncbi:MAG: tRNA pseudouridine(38-40) synthase TruA [Proteobacteria bacterium]|nr:tRNA pseudouridine(38-40) synthase TruA [Pseudomonadota bacterium]MBU1739197.1 tRNA pseudouridine(38-40) synthase TruA [Pseudomonadota bacterium]